MCAIYFVYACVRVLARKEKNSAFCINWEIECRSGSWGRSEPYPLPTGSNIRPWYDAQAIARAHAITCANEEKGSLGSQ